MQKYKNPNMYLWGIVFFIIACSVREILFAPRDIADITINTFAGHEWKYNVWRMLAMADAITDGSSGRWVESFSFGWGYPIFYYTAPIPYLLGSLLVIIGVDPIAALNISWISIYFLTGAFMFWAMRPIVGVPGALLAMVCYVFAPYHLVDTYVRTNLVETTAFIFPPLIIRALWLARTETIKAWVLGAFAIACIPLTHMLSTYLIGLGLIVFTLAYVAFSEKQLRFKIFKSSCVMALAGLTLSAFFWVPAVMDIGAVRGFEAMSEGYYHYSNHFVYPHQLVDSAWHYGGSEIGPRDYMSFSIGKIILVIVIATLLVTLGLVAAKAIRKTESYQSMESKVAEKGLIALALSSIIAAAVMVYFTTQASAWAWQIIPKLEAVQFPWRFLFPASFFLAIAAGCLPKIMNSFLQSLVQRSPIKNSVLAQPSFQKLIMLCVGTSLCIGVMFQHWDYAKPGQHTEMERSEQTTQYHSTKGVWTTNTLEFMPKDVSTYPYPGTQPKTQGKYVNEFYNTEERILKSEQGNGWASFTLLRGAAGKLIFNQHWHPGWKVLIDGKAADTKVLKEHPFAPVVVDLPENARNVTFYFGFTTAGIIGLTLSISFLMFLLFGFIRADKESLFIEYECLQVYLRPCFCCITFPAVDFYLKIKNNL